MKIDKSKSRVKKKEGARSWKKTHQSSFLPSIVERKVIECKAWGGEKRIEKQDWRCKGGHSGKHQEETTTMVAFTKLVGKSKERERAKDVMDRSLSCVVEDRYERRDCENELSSLCDFNEAMRTTRTIIREDLRKDLNGVKYIEGS